MTKSYDIKRGGVLIATVKPEGYTSEAIMGDSSAALSFTLPAPVAFHIGDTIRIDSVDFILNTEPTVTKISRIEFKYQLLFQGYKFELSKTALLFLGATNELKEVDFALMGNAETFIDLIVANMNREHTGWVRGTVDATDYKNLTFSEQNCLSALADLAVEFKTEYWISGKTIHLTKKGAISGLNLEYGKGKGLYSISRSQPSNKNVFTRIIARGGTKNIPGTYRGGSTRLQLPGVLNYLERNVAKYGVIEVSRTYDEIFPRREGIVTSVGDKFTVVDSGIDFDLNSPAILIPGVTAKITFNTGQLAGYVFDIATYDHATKTIVFNLNKDERALEIPSDLIKAAIGDKYILTDIIMPIQYIEARELDVQATALAELIENSDPWAEYRVDPDPLHFKRQSIVINLGDYVHLLDTDLSIDDDIRVIGYKKDLQDYFKYTEINLATVVVISTLVREYAKLEKNDRAIYLNRLTDPARARRNYKTTQELSTMLETLRAEMLVVMVPGGAFSSDIASEVNASTFRTSAGSIQHAEYVEHAGIWNVAALTYTIPTNAPYYVYIKASRSADTAVVVTSLTKVGVFDVDGYYHFPFGIISSIIEGTRVFESIKGYTRIVGDNIKTGSISGNGLVIDLDNGTGIGKFTFSAGSSGYGNLTDKPNLAVYALSSALSAYALNSSLGSLAFDNLVEAAKLGSTVIVGGYIKASLLNVSAIIVAGGIETTSGAQSKANAAQAAAQLAASGYVSGLSSTLGTLAYQSAVALASLDSTIIVGGYIKSTLLDVSAIIVSGSLSTTTDAQARANGAQSAAQVYAAAQAAAAQAAAQAFATSATNGLAASLGSLAYQSLVQDAMLGSTVMVGGYIKTSLLDVNFIKGLNFNFVMGKIGKWNIDANGLVNETSDDAYIKQIKTFGDGTTAEVRIGTNVFPSPIPGINSRLTGYFINDEIHSGINGAIYARATGGATANIAAEFVGDVSISGSLFIDGNTTIDGIVDFTTISEIDLPALSFTSTLDGFYRLCRRNSDGRLFRY